jgi:hypothetical protein
MSDQIVDYSADPIPQDETRGPGWFLKISYVVIVAFMLYYLFTNWTWKSNYEEQQEKIKMELSK